MILCVKVARRDAQEMKRRLQREGRFREGYAYDKDEEHIYFPVTGRFPGAEFTERDVKETPKKEGLKEQLKGRLSDEEMERLKRSFDTVGSIAIIEVDDALASREALIGETILAANKNITTVLKKEGGHEGELRLQRYRCIAGDDTRETTVIENGVRLRIDVEQVYYSVRSATERKRVASLVRPGEQILVMFSGAAPYPCVIAKTTKAAEVTGIELNERGHELGIENCRLNKLTNVVLIQGDVKQVIPELAARKIAFDRIIMPLPHTGNDFLDEAFAVAKKGCAIHLYAFEEEGFFERAAEKAKEGAERNGRQVTVLTITPSGQHSPRLFRVCVDLIVEE